MRLLIYLLLFAFSCVQCKNHVRALTESMGQEIIEMGSPIKELPPGLDEEPSADIEEETTTAPPPTKRETRKTTTTPSPAALKIATVNLRRAGNENLSQEEEETRIEKELSEIYKDNDYKAEMSKETTKPPTTTTPTTTTTQETKPIARQAKRVNFKFQPDINDRADVERFRTSVDDISCEKRVTQRLADSKPIVVLNQAILEEKLKVEQQEQKISASSSFLRSTAALCLALLSTLICL